MTTWFVTYKLPVSAKYYFEENIQGKQRFKVSRTQYPDTLRVVAPRAMYPADVRVELGRAGRITGLSRVPRGPDPEIVITYYHPEDAQKATEIFDRFPLQGVLLTVEDNNMVVTIKDYPLQVTRQEVLDLFERVGAICSIVMPDPIARTYANPTNQYVASLRADPIYSDLTVVVGPQRFKVHRAILAKSGAFFSELLTVSGGLNEVTIEGVTDPVLFGDLLDLICGVAMPIDGDRTVKMLQLAVELDITGINWVEILPFIAVTDKSGIQGLVELVYPNPDEVPRSVLANLVPNTE